MSSSKLNYKLLPVCRVYIMCTFLIVAVEKKKDLLCNKR